MHLRSSLQAVLPAALAALALSACDAKRTAIEAPQVAVAVEPPAAVVPAGGKTQFAAVVSGAADTSVTWSVVEVGGGTVDGAGSYTAPTGAGTYHVQAASHADPAKKAAAAVTVQPPP